MRPLDFLNITQFLGAFNDNLFKFGLAFFLIELEGTDKTSEILGLSSAVFVLPFILFGAPAGQLADKSSKNRLIVLTKVLELVAMALASVTMYFHLKWLSLFFLFVMAFQSTLFGPAKYGIIPELVAKEEIPRANGLITSWTFLAVITGSGSASLILDFTESTAILMAVTIVIAVIGLLSSLFIPHTTPIHKEGTVDIIFWQTALQAIREMKKEPPLLSVALASAYLLLLASYMQLNMVPFAYESLHLSILAGGYLIFLSSLGIAVGAYIVGHFCKIKLVPIACLLLGLVLIALGLFSEHLLVAMILLPIVGLLGGFYQVPLDAYMQRFAPNARRGVYIGTTSFLCFLGVMISSILIYLFKMIGLTPDQGFILMGALTCFVAIRMYRPFLL